MRSDLVKALETLRRSGPETTERALLYLQGTVFSFSLKLCGNRADAEDTMQETLLRVIPYLGRFDCPEALAVWLYKTARTRCLMSRRKSRYAPRVEVPLEEATGERGGSSPLVVAAGETPEASAMRQESEELLRQAVLKLPVPLRVVLVLHDMEGFSTSETARVLSLREGTVRVRLHRARMLLREELAGSKGPVRGRPKRELPPRCRKLAEQLSEYLDHRMAEALCEELARHIETCEECRARLASLERIVETCRKMSLPGLDPQTAARSRQMLLDEYQRVLASIQRRNRLARPAPETGGGT